MNRRTHRNHSSSKTQARIARVKDKLQKLRDRVRRSAVMFWERRQARLTWWQQAFRTPMASGRWVFSQSRTLWSAFLTLLGLAPSGRARLLARSSDIRGNKARKAASRNHLILEGLEQRQLLAGDLYVDNPVDYIVTTNNAGGAGADPTDEVRWVGFNGIDDGGLGDDVVGLIYGTDAFGSIQDAISAAAPTNTVNVAPGTYVESLSIPTELTLLGPNSGIAGNGVRGAEASIVAPAAALTAAMIDVTADNVTINGFYLDGNGAVGNVVRVVQFSSVDNGVVQDSRITGGERGIQYNGAA
ncbi:MAG: hypothetical protein IT422_10320, partial [Pirellulaceae bacterium]|nr:hypothetical protein [Pirellulaceae bacterium]